MAPSVLQWSTQLKTHRLFVLLGSLIFLSGCPTDPERQTGTANPCAADPADIEIDAAEVEVILSRVRDMVKAQQEKDRVTFADSFLPDSSAYEIMTELYEDWEGSGRRLEIVSIELSAADDKYALVEFEFRISGGGEEPQTEEGGMEMMKDQQGVWVINDMG